MFIFIGQAGAIEATGWYLTYEKANNFVFPDALEDDVYVSLFISTEAQDLNIANIIGKLKQDTLHQCCEQITRELLTMQVVTITDFIELVVTWLFEDSTIKIPTYSSLLSEEVINLIAKRGIVTELIEENPHH